MKDVLQKYVQFITGVSAEKGKGTQFINFFSISKHFILVNGLCEPSLTEGLMQEYTLDGTLVYCRAHIRTLIQT